MKKYILTVSTNTDGKTSVNSNRSGYNALELLGILEVEMNGILRQLSGAMEPDSIVRTRIEDSDLNL